MNIAHINKKRVILGLLICLIAACRTTPVATPPPESSAPPTLAPPDTPTLTEIPATPTLTPTPQTPLPTETVTPVPTPTSPAAIVELDGAVLPPGFSLIQYATLYRPTVFAFDAEGHLYVTSTDGNVYRLSDTNGDGRADEQSVFATGMRNPYDLAFHPLTREMFATDNGRDDLGLNAPFEELNHIVQGGNYGFPGCWNTHEQSGCEQMIPAIAFFEPHSSANGLTFYDGARFPEIYRNNAFVSIFGSWLKPGLQTGVQRVILTPNGNTYTTQTEWFLRFPAGVMPLPLLTGPDGALYVGDYINNVIYRVSYGP